MSTKVLFSHAIRTLSGLAVLLVLGGAGYSFLAMLVLLSISGAALYYAFKLIGRGWHTWAWVPFAEFFVGLWLALNLGAWAQGAAFMAALVSALGGEMRTGAFAGALSWWPFTVMLSVLASALIFHALQRLRSANWAAVKGRFAGQAQAPQPPQTAPAPQAQPAPPQPATTQAEPEEWVRARPARASSATDAASPALMFPARRPKYNFSAVVGMDHLKGCLLKAVENFEEDGGNGILLSGDPGNGKTFMAEALAGELGCSFLEARTSELTSRWMGAGAENITRIFADARAQAPVLLFLDEFDSFMGDRSGMNSGGAAGQDNLVNANTFLTAIADMNKGLLQHQVLIVAATNFRDNLDEGGVREGRFDAKVEVPPPDMQARYALLMTHLRPYEQRLDKSAVQSILRRWEDWSATRILAISKGAARKLKEDSSLQLNPALLRSVIDDLTSGSGTRLSESALRLEQLQFPDELHQSLGLLVTKLKYPERIEVNGATLPRGAVFYGPAGTGKTAAAQALALETGWRFLATSSPDLLAAPDKIDKLVKKARDIRPCIIFIDEAEGVLASREGNLNPYAKEVTNKLLSVMDGPRKLHDVFFVAATNFAQGLDAAMVRMGRFSEHFDFTPDEKSLCAVVQAYVSQRPQVRWEGEPADLVARYPHLGPSEISGLLNRAISDTGAASIGLGHLQPGKKMPGIVVDLREV